MTLEKISKHFADIERKLGKSNKIVAKGESMKVTDAIKLGAKSNSIVSTIKKAVKDYQSFEPTEAESKTVLDKMTTIVGLTEEQLNLLVKNRSQFDKLHVGGLVKKNMSKSDAASSELADTMLAKAPASLKPQAEQLNQRRVAAFKSGTTNFANATGGEDKADNVDDSD